MNSCVLITPSENGFELKFRVISLIVKELLELAEKNRQVNLNELKYQVCKNLKVSKPPKLYEIISAIPKNRINELLPRLQVKPSRTASGIAVVAVMSKPHRCPHIYYTGNICVYCPGGPDSDFSFSAQSFSGHENTSKRAKSVRFDPYLQVRERIQHLECLGHNTDKIELIVMGGTFMSLPKEHRDQFIIGLHDAISGNISKNIQEAVFFGERSVKHRCVGLTIETRPDYCQVKHIREMLAYGSTRLEIGIQSIYEDVALDTNRGHTVAATCDSMKMSKEYGFKITAHMMPDLPNVGIERDVYQFDEYFKNPDFRSDGLKIYPTLVVRGTGLYELWKTKRYQNYSATILIDLIAHIMSLVPPWVRVYRIQRDMPLALVSSCGAPFCHLRELVMERMKNLGLKTYDVRTREVGHRELHDQLKPGDLELIRRDYFANGGWETFLSYEDPKQDILVGLLRLRKCAENPYTGLKNWSVIRELHVYGTAVSVSEREESKYQHKGFGALLMDEAEKIAFQEHGSSQIGVIAGIGVREYYRKLGYTLASPYMVKNLCI